MNPGWKVWSVISRINRAREIMPGCTPSVKAIDLRSPHGQGGEVFLEDQGLLPFTDRVVLH